MYKETEENCDDIKSERATDIKLSGKENVEVETEENCDDIKSERATDIKLSGKENVEVETE
jgi:hypothetical protein